MNNLAISRREHQPTSEYWMCCLHVDWLLRRTFIYLYWYIFTVTLSYHNHIAVFKNSNFVYMLLIKSVQICGILAADEDDDERSYATRTMCASGMRSEGDPCSISAAIVCRGAWIWLLYGLINVDHIEMGQLSLWTKWLIKAFTWLNLAMRTKWNKLFIAVYMDIHSSTDP